jgi:hypothetical protein
MAPVEITQQTFCAVVQYVAILRHIQKLIFLFVNQLVHSLSFALAYQAYYLFCKKL